MKKIVFISCFLFILQYTFSQKLSLEPHPYSEELKSGNQAWFSLELTNDTNKDIAVFNSPMKDYGVGGYEYTITCNGEEVVRGSTRQLDTNEFYSEKSVMVLNPGKTRSLLGIRFLLPEAGKYVVNVTYYQDPAGMVKGWAKNKKAVKVVRNITKYKAELVEEFYVD